MTNYDWGGVQRPKFSNTLPEGAGQPRPHGLGGLGSSRGPASDPGPREEETNAYLPLQTINDTGPAGGVTLQKGDGSVPGMGAPLKTDSAH